jgi:RNA polymerase sigma factor for flagellar operon FliA
MHLRAEERVLRLPAGRTLTVTPEELAPVWAAYWDGDPADREEAHDILVRQFLPLANYLARQSLAKAPAHQDPDDIHAYAHRGLLKAIERFRPDAGAKFETYATRRITGTIMDGQRNDDPLTRISRRRVKTVAAGADEVWSTLGREPTIAEIAKAADVEEDVVRHALLEQQSLNASLDALSEAGHEEHTDGDAEIAGQIAEVRTLVAQRLAHMDGRERAFALLYYSADLSMSEAATELDIGSDWCSRTKKNVLEAVRGR